MYYNKNVIFVLLCLILLISGSFSAQVLKPLGLTRIKRSQPKSDYHVECKQSMTGLFSFFVVPILLGDITLDFMSMIDVMVDVMVTATGMDDGMGGNNNNNNNNNENMNRKKRSKKRNFRKDKMETYDSVLDSFLEFPSNHSMVNHYENMAKNHMDIYLNLLLKKNISAGDQNFVSNDLIGKRKSKSKPKEENNKKIVPQEFAVNFFSSLLGGYRKFKNYCKINNTEECEIFDSDDAILAKAIKKYNGIFENTDLL